MDTITVSASEFRNNLFEYGALVQKGKTILVRNDKTKTDIFKITAPDKLSADEELKLLRRGWGTWANLPPDTNRAKLRKADRAYAKRLQKGQM